MNYQQTNMDQYIPQGSQICSSGIVKTLFTENKFTLHDDFIEIYQNSDDAGSTLMDVEIITHDGKPYLKIEDDGCGMTIEQIDHSLNLLKRGSKGGNQHGKFNFGGKAAVLHLSGIANHLNSLNQEYEGICIVMSKTETTEPVCYEMLGNKLINRGWDGSVMPVYLNSGSETKRCSEFYKQYPITNHGTKIFIQLQDDVKKELEENSQEIKKGLQVACNERLNHCKLNMSISGIDISNIIYEPIVDPNIIRQKKYNIRIKVYQQDNIYVFPIESIGTKYLDEKDLWIKPISKNGGKWSSKLQSIKKGDLDKYEYVGEFTIEIGCNFTYEKDVKYDHQRSDNYIHIVRNGFCLNKYNNTCVNKKTNAGDFYKRNIWKNMKSTLSYTTSEKGDILDKIIGVNMHKADIKWEKLPKNLSRTIENIFEIFGTKIVKYVDLIEYRLENKCTSYHQRLKRSCFSHWKQYKQEHEEQSDGEVTDVSEEEVENNIVSEEEVENNIVSEEEVENNIVSEEEVENVNVSEEVENVDVSDGVEGINIDSVDNEEGNNNTSSKEKLMRLWLEYYNSERDDENMNQRLLTILQTNVQ